MPKYGLINSKLLEVVLQNEEVFSKRGAMIACRGKVNFARSFLGSGGVQDLAMRAVTNEGVDLMVANGNGQVYYAFDGMHVTVINLHGETFYIESHSLLAFDRRLRVGTSFLGNQGGLQGLVRGAMTGQGLFTTTLDGHGEFAFVSDGDTISLDVFPDKPIFVDPQAYVGHRGQITSSIATDTSWKTFIGQGSGESFQLKFTGSGTVYIQASER
ncbi:MAG: AIM24 family protein [Blastocatellia bacterium]|nr:AIM24 family protein [Blastocatellia bacterium]